MRSLQTPAPVGFRRDQRGFTGAEKALLICFGLAIVSVVGYLVQAGSSKAGGDAQRTLAAGQGAIGQIGGSKAILQPGAIGSSGQAIRAAALPAPSAAPQPLPNGLDESRYDGTVIGANGRAYPAGTPLGEVPPVLPSNGKVTGTEIVYVNGISNNKDDQFQTMQAIADESGSPIIGIHNSTDGLVGDLGQSLGDKVNLGDNAAVDSLTNVLYDSVQQGKPIHIMGHSQGALITSRALYNVQQRLMIEDGLTAQQAAQKMGQIQVETFGGAATSYPDGPQYVHYVNRMDPVPDAFGLGPFGSTGAGAGAKIIRFTDPGASVNVGWHWPPVSVHYDPHGMAPVYLPHRLPFAQAYGQ